MNRPIRSNSNLSAGLSLIALVVLLLTTVNCDDSQRIDRGITIPDTSVDWTGPVELDLSGPQGDMGTDTAEDATLLDRGTLDGPHPEEMTPEEMTPEEMTPEEMTPEEMTPGDTSTDLQGTINSCLEVCSNRMATDGTCFPDDYEECQERCTVDFAGWSVELQETFIDCIENDPLCFQGIDGCVMYSLYDNYTLLSSIHLEASGFNEYNGLDFYAFIDAAPGLMNFLERLEIAAGAVSFTWTNVDMYPSETGLLILGYVDLNENAQCDEVGDWHMSEYAEFNGDFEDPTYNLYVTPAVISTGWECQFID
jgi:hypothetical protein